ncbi:hypothetical protein NC653_000071 [Populus alba x Populus x berolinensis]|uniref:Uncharacterized protein n=1 Tax=Populus alba x Populus x berolinensis TaxID=444605 RepID=A0AAD6WE14_9ROSI|nr:hypothetical protein NC653_000067 [Populus alba x Populus x berolinensis]KAJ7009294.1 hypothetical protein NC653_000071 [Populus alba x Populus x berolinensis]
MRLDLIEFNSRFQPTTNMRLCLSNLIDSLKIYSIAFINNS